MCIDTLYFAKAVLRSEIAQWSPGPFIGPQHPSTQVLVAAEQVVLQDVDKFDV